MVSKNEMVYSTRHLRTCIQQIMNQWWARGTSAQQNNYGCLPATSYTQNWVQKGHCTKGLYNILRFKPK